MTINLKDKERLDELQRNGYQIIQNPEKFCFGMDAVLLSGFARAREGDRVLDMGTGTGIIPILMEAKTQADMLIGLEIQPESADMARRSVALNHLEHKIQIIEGDIKEAASIFGAASFDVVTCNPPYMTEHHGITNPEAPKAIAKSTHTTAGTAGFSAIRRVQTIPTKERIEPIEISIPPVKITIISAIARIPYTALFCNILTIELKEYMDGVRIFAIMRRTISPKQRPKFLLSVIFFTKDLLLPILSCPLLLQILRNVQESFPALILYFPKYRKHVRFS